MNVKPCTGASGYWEKEDVMKRKNWVSFFCVFLILVSYIFLVVFFGDSEGEIHPHHVAEAPVYEPVFHLWDFEVEEGQDIILTVYRDEMFRNDVLAFFQSITGSEEVAGVILAYASVHDIPPALAFALCAEESAYNPQAFNRNRNDTVDRGLFQLNSASFPKLSVDDFYDLHENANNGLSHLRWCLDTAGTEVAGLAMYNAGATRVGSAGTPKSTLDYVSRILKRQRMIEDLFLAECIRIIRSPGIETENDETPERASFRLNLLTPLGR